MSERYSYIARTHSRNLPQLRYWTSSLHIAIFAITGIGDCGSCSTNSVHDGIEIEKKGIPGVAICTEAFLPGLDALTKMRGMPDYRFAVVPHPLGVLFDDELRQRAKLAAPQVIDIVLGVGRNSGSSTVAA